MKFKLNQGRFSMRKRLLMNIMRTFIFLCCTIGFALSPNDIVAQNTKIIVEEDTSLSMDEVFKLIMNQTDYKFFYEKGTFKDLPEINVKEGVVNVNKLLVRSLSNGNFDIEVTEKNVILIKEIAVSESIKKKVQEHQISGVVVDKDGNPLPGASIMEKGTINGTETDFDGNFSLTVSNENAILVISFIGFTPIELAVDGQSTINVTLQEDAAQLDEVVLIGYGSVKKSDLTGSVSRVNSKSFENQPLARVEEALQGRASGVIVTKSNGKPGAAIKVRIRGVNSITGNNAPLVVVDGIQGGDLSTINPNDIETMDVLKDASATAIYGVRGSNGVIMITTKKGRGKPKLNVNYFTSISQVPRLLPTLGEDAAEFARIENLRRTNSGGSPIFTDGEIANLVTNGGTNYQDEVFQTAINQNLQISTSGSEGKINYFLSGGYRDEEGAVLNTGFEQLSLRGKIGVQISDKLKMGLNLFGSRGVDKGVPGGDQNFIRYALTWDPTTPIYDAIGNYNRRSLKGIGNQWHNPVFTISEGDVESVIRQMNSTFTLDYDITDNLTYSMIAGSILNDRKVSSYQANTVSDLPNAFYRNNENSFSQISNIFTWKKNFDNSDLKLIGVQEYSKTTNIANGYNANNMTLPRGFYLAELADPAGQSISNDFNERQLSSYMVRAEFNMNNLHVAATGRYDGTSVFREDKRWGFFPSLAASYNLQNLMNESGAISNLNIRAGWGQVGNQGVGPYSTYGSLGNRAYSYNLTGTTGGTVLSSFENKDLTWETTTQTNVGIDIGIMAGRGNLSLDVYTKKTTDLLLAVPVPSTFGGGIINQNVGEVKNIGFDLTLGYDIIESDNFTWNSMLTYTYVKNEVTKLYGDVETIQGNFIVPVMNVSANIIQRGEPLGQFQGRVFEGTWKSSEAAAAAAVGKVPGQAKYKRGANGDIVLETIGNGTPTAFFGWSNTLKYKKFDMNLFFQGASGFDIYNLQQGEINGGGGDSRSFMSVEQLNQWTPANETDIPTSSTDTGSSRFVEKGDYIRLQNLSVGYSMDNLLGESISLKLYVAGQNLFMITDYSGYDPELSDTSRNGADVAPGIHVGSYPNPRTYVFGVNIGL